MEKKESVKVTRAANAWQHHTAMSCRSPLFRRQPERWTAQKESSKKRKKKNRKRRNSVITRKLTESQPYKPSRLHRKTSPPHLTSPFPPTERDMTSTSRRLLLAAAALLVAAGAAILAEAQTPATATCAAKLVPCADYMNSTNPPDTCCNPIKEAVANDLACLCNLYNTPGFLESLGINVTQALQLTKECGASTDTSICANATSPSSSTTPPPPATPGGDAGRIAWSGVSSSLLVLASMMFY